MGTPGALVAAMKITPPIALRFLGALVLALVIAGLQYTLWAKANQSPNIADAQDTIRGFAYAAYRRDESPLKQTYPTPQEISDDLDLLSQTAGRVRTYSALENPSVIDLAYEHSMRLTLGAWLSKDQARNERELAAAIRTALDNRHVERVIVGNETVLRGDLTVPELEAYLDRARAALHHIPVSTAEPWHVWLRNPDLARHVDFIAVHLLPYHEGVPVAQAVDYAMERYRQLVQAFPKKRVVIGEIGWPSNGPIIGGAVPSVANQARFIREFLATSRDMNLDYFLMEAFDQPWKIDVEGWAGAYWGLYNADRELKFPLEGDVIRDVHWQDKAWIAALLAFVPMVLVAYFLPGWGLAGRLWLCLLIQACTTTLVIGMSVPVDYYLTRRDLLGLVILTLATVITVAVLLSHGFEFGEVLFKGRWLRHFEPLAPPPADQEPFVSIHLACCNEPPDMVIATIDSLARLHYRHFEVLVIDNNTTDEALWKPVQAHMAGLGPNFRFFHLLPWHGFKAGALNFALEHTDPRAQVVGVVDADYVVEPDWLACLVGHFAAPEVAVVQAPQAHREWQNQPFRRMCNWEFDGFFRIGMHHRNERNALIQHGTMTLVRRSALDRVGGWSEWCICEDTELGLRLIEAGNETRYVDCVLGRGLTPADFAAAKSQRMRWAFGAMQILKHHLPRLVGQSRLNLAQRYHFLTGWFSWFGDALQLIFAFASIAWTVGMLAAPKSFGLPVAMMVVPILGFMAFKAALGPILYRRTMDCPWADIAGASLLSVGLSHAIARGVFAGLIKRHGEFVRTPKGWKAKGRFAFFGPIREELGLLLALLTCMGAMIWMRGLADLEALVWIGVLALESLPYWAALGCQIAAYWPEQESNDREPEGARRV